MSQEFVGPLTVTSALGIQGGSLELGATLGAAPETPYVDFHFGLGAAQDYNVRLLNAADNRLDVVTASGGPVVSIQTDKMGIGTTTPRAKLVVNEPAGGAEVRVDGLNGTVGLTLGADAVQPWVGTRTNHALRLLTNNTEQMRVQADGRVGIGTNTPSEKLDVNGRVKSGALSLGPWPANGSYMYFGVNTLAQTQAGNYALLQQAVGDGTGTTFLNSPLSIRFRIGNNDKIVLENNGDVDLIPPGRLNFGALTRQMINLWSTEYGIGIQAGTQYYRTGGHFSWFLGGTHNDATFNPGGGTRLMTLNNWGDLILSARTNPSANPNGSLCRALVDFDNLLVINYANDYARGVQISSNLTLTGNGFKPGGGFWGSTSDIRLKQNVQPLAGALDKLLRLRGVFFEWKEPKHQGNLTGPQMGLIADEVEEVFPEWISVDPEGYKQLTVRGFEALVVEALRALKAKNDHIKVQNQALETRVVGLETQLQASVSTHDLHNHGATR